MSSGVAHPRSAAQEFWNKNQKGYTLLPAHVRDHIVESGGVLQIWAIRESKTDQFGPCWASDIEYEREMWTLLQSHNQVRDQWMVNAREFLASGNGPLPATMFSFDTKRGTGYDFGPPPPDYVPDVAALAESSGDAPF